MSTYAHMSSHPTLEALADFASDVLGNQEAYEIETHVQRCPHCADLLASSEQVAYALHADAGEPMPEPVWTQLRQRMFPDSLTTTPPPPPIPAAGDTPPPLTSGVRLYPGGNPLDVTGGWAGNTGWYPPEAGNTWPQPAIVDRPSAQQPDPVTADDAPTSSWDSFALAHPMMQQWESGEDVLQGRSLEETAPPPPAAAADSFSSQLARRPGRTATSRRQLREDQKDPWWITQRRPLLAAASTVMVLVLATVAWSMLRDRPSTTAASADGPPPTYYVLSTGTQYTVTGIVNQAKPLTKLAANPVAAAAPQAEAGAPAPAAAGRDAAIKSAALPSKPPEGDLTLKNPEKMAQCAEKFGILNQPIVVDFSTYQGRDAAILVFSMEKSAGPPAYEVYVVSRTCTSNDDPLFFKQL